MKPYIPENLPLVFEQNLSHDILLLHHKALAELLRFDGMISSISNASLLIAPLINSEATISSQIEGTQASLQDLMEDDVGRLQDITKKQDTRVC